MTRSDSLKPCTSARRLANAGKYKPLPKTSLLPDFDNYAGFEARGLQEIQQLQRMAGDKGDGRVYYTSMAQEYLLDELITDWKICTFQEGIWLEDLLEEAVDG